jgi:imidazole glycerol-phosphate synthase subunit HisF
VKTFRIIPRLDIKGPNLVKGIHLEGLRVLGSPEKFARYYYESGADELFYQDVVASLYNRNSLHEIITKTAREIFIPLTVGGGLRSLDDIRDVLRAGADKVSLNTAVIKNPGLIKEASREFGSSTIVVAIEAIRQAGGNYLVYTDNGREYTGIEAVTWAKNAEENGAGELVVTSVDRDGTGFGFDLELIRLISDTVSIPVIAHGGAGKPADVAEVISNGHADAVAVASILHYGYLSEDIEELSGRTEGNIEFLKKGIGYSKITPSKLEAIKEFLKEREISVRI